VRHATIEALASYEGEIVESLRPLLSQTEPDVEPLLKQLRDEATLEGRIRAVRVIGEMGNHHAVETLKQIRREAADGAGLPLRRAINRALFQLGCGAWERYCALAVIGRVGREEHVDLLLPSLGHPSYYVRNRAVRSLAPFALPRVAKALARTATGDPRYFVRRAALQVLGGQAGDKALRVRTALTAFGDSAAGVRAEAARVLGRLLDPRGLRPLVSGLLDPVWSVREACEVALRNFPDLAARPVSKLLDEEREFVRYRVARLLGRLGDPVAVPALKRRLKQEAEGCRVHEAIVESLKRLGT
jgi:HEAT repeat protein